MLVIDGRFHANATYVSDLLVVAGDHLWILAGASAGPPAQASILRLPLSELR